MISDKGRGEWQGGQPAGACQCGVNSGLSDRDSSWHAELSCSWKRGSSMSWLDHDGRGRHETAVLNVSPRVVAVRSPNE